MNDETNTNLVVLVAGARGKANLILEGHLHQCGEIENGIGAYLDDERGGFVIDWPSFEAAYLALKETRMEAEIAFERALADPTSMAATYRAFREEMRAKGI
jgi:hypothetical protein